jgi:hypothetical protein
MVDSPKDKYKTLRDNYPFGIDTHSGLVAYNHQWIICLKMHYAGIQYLPFVTNVEPEWPILRAWSVHSIVGGVFIFFDDDRLPEKFGGELRNPAVKKALDKNRSRVQQSSQRV